MLIRLGIDDLKVVLRDTGNLIQYSAALFIVPLLVGIWFGEPTFFLGVYILTGLFAFFLGTAMKRVFKTNQATDLKHAFMVVAAIWLLFTAIAAIPFVLIMGMTFIDSIFETMSSMTTTGLTMMNLIIDSAPNSLIFWRSFISWVGGVGIIVLSLMGIFTLTLKALN